MNNILVEDVYLNNLVSMVSVSLDNFACSWSCNISSKSGTYFRFVRPMVISIFFIDLPNKTLKQILEYGIAGFKRQA